MYVLTVLQLGYINDHIDTALFLQYVSFWPQEKYLLPI